MELPHLCCQCEKELTDDPWYVPQPGPQDHVCEVCDECFNKHGGNIQGCILEEPCCACGCVIRKWPLRADQWGTYKGRFLYKCWDCIAQKHRAHTAKVYACILGGYCANHECEFGAKCKNWKHYTTRD